MLSNPSSRSFRSSLAAVALCVTAVFPLHLSGQQATLVADAHVSVARPTVNSGSLSNLVVGNGYTTFLQFDLETLPPATTPTQITRAILRVYCNRVDGPGTVSIQTLTSSWSEGAVTYAASPSIGTVVGSGPVSTAGQFVAFDVTAQVQAWVSSPATNYGLALTSAAANLQFDSKENDETGHAPQLDIALAAGGTPGPQGPAGPTGSQGPAGANGGVGPQGPAGLTGATGLTGAPGSQGPQGLQGIAGAVGPQGPAGLPGNAVAGPQGPVGPQGPAGSAGLTYQGAYSAQKNYALGDVVLFGGSSYSSLQAGNHGNTPDASPSAWGVLTAQGPTGPAGPIGVTGIAGPEGQAGPVGPAGERGLQGPQGPAGQAGAQGISGATGAQGLQGPAGPQGNAGPTGLAFQGTYSSTKNYSLGDGVLWQGSGWVSLTNSNHGNTPDQSPASWSLFAAAGSPGAKGDDGTAGPIGPAGTNGTAGAVGPEGPAGPVGAAGTPGLTFRGVYSSVTNYTVGDVVFWNGSSFASLTTANHGNTPDQSPASWSLLTAQGAQGAAGATGATGPAGPQGLPGSVGPNGPKGDQGSQGIAGQAGAQGIAGASGAQGLQGPMGPQGPQGVAGLSFRGPYSSTTNYAAGDGVLWQGAGWVSLIASNHGNTPDQSPTSWQMFSAPGAAGAAGAAGPAGPMGLSGQNGAPGATGPVGPAGVQGQQGVVGPAGPAGVAGPQGTQGPAGVQGLTGDAGPRGDKGDTGAQGLAGQAGAQGIQGVAGPQGLPGAVGAQGPAGPVGLTFQGDYSSAANYSVSDGVLWQGASYVSLQAPNHGNTPDQSPLFWKMFAAAGAQGPQGIAGPAGAQGATGAMGPQGLSGANGTNGAQGPIGLTGAQGPQGLTGATGIQGPTGTQGVPGERGPQGDKGDTGAQGLAGQAGAQGVAGPAGPAGSQGVAGAAGPAGSTGDAGPQGPAGPIGINFRGAWNNSTHYNIPDAVTYNGSTYLAAVASTNLQPDQAPGSWTVLAQAGSAGVAGSVGPAGATGAQGATGPSGPQGATGAAGPSGPAGLTGAPGTAGTNGTNGAQGAPGVVGMTFRNAWSPSTHYTFRDVVTYSGSTYFAETDSTGQSPDSSASFWSLLAQVGSTGPSGAIGMTGASASVSVNSVTTLSPGAAAIVTNSGTAQNVLLNFGIPQGAAGTGGTSNSVPGESFPAIAHSTTNASPIVSLSSGNAGVTPESLSNFAAVTWMPRACSAVRLDVYSTQATAGGITLHVGTAPGSMSSTAMSCTFGANAHSCSAPGPISIAQGSFIDAAVSGMTSSSTYVWTSFECDVQ